MDDRKETLEFVCNICESTVRQPVDRIDREEDSCPTCHSTVRMRSIAYLLSLALYGKPLPLPRFPADAKVVGVGLSDWIGYANPLAKRLGYTNTFYHQQPYLDITAPPAEWVGRCDFVISSDVFEHVPTPVDRAFTGAFNLLKPGGHLILTVPFTNAEQTTEHFPEMHEFRLVDFNGTYVLVNRAADGRFSLHTDLIFHGGPGTTLEMRVFCRADLERLLTAAGFINIQVFDQDVRPCGILHKVAWSLPIVAQRPPLEAADEAPSRRRWFPLLGRR